MATPVIVTLPVGASLTLITAAVAADVTDSDDTLKGFATGIPELSVTCEVVGGVTLSVGDLGAVAVAWGDIGASTDGTIAAAQVESVSTQGNMDGEVTSSVTFCNAAPTV